MESLEREAMSTQIRGLLPSGGPEVLHLISTRRLRSPGSELHHPHPTPSRVRSLLSPSNVWEAQGDGSWGRGWGGGEGDVPQTCPGLGACPLVSP